MIERYKKRTQKWGQKLINISFGVTPLEKRAIELLEDEANEKTGRTDISQSLILQDMLDQNPDMVRMKTVAQKQLNKESSSNDKGTRTTR